MLIFIQGFTTDLSPISESNNFSPTMRHILLAFLSAAAFLLAPSVN